MAKLGRPQIIINFKTKSTTAITRSGRGIGVMILNDENASTDKVTTYTLLMKQKFLPAVFLIKV